MPEYLSPGVYIQETSFRGKPIEGVSTSTAGLVGRTRKGRVGRPTLVTSFGEFVRAFGDPFSGPDLAKLGAYLGHAVRAFFNNGGKRAYVVRVLGDGASPAAQTAFQGVAYRLPNNVTVRGPTTVLPLGSLRGIQNGTALEIFVRPSPSGAWVSKGTFNVDSYDAVRSTVTLQGAGLPASLTLDPQNTAVVRSGLSPTAAGPVFTARDPGAGGNDLAVNFRPVDLPPVRLQPRKFARARPSFATTPGAAPERRLLGPDALPSLRVGDTVQFTDSTGASPALTIATIPDVNVRFTVATGGSTVAYPAASSLTLTTRGSFAANVALGQLGFGLDLSAGVTADGATVATKSFAHPIAALLHPNDVIQINSGADTATITVVSVDFPATTEVTFSGPTGTRPTLSLVSTPGRLFVPDVSGLQIPARHTGATVTAEPLAVTNGTAVDAASALLVDTVTNSVLLSGVGLAGPPVTDDDWTSFESLHLGGNGSSVLPVASTAGFYVGAIVEIDTGAAKTPSVVAAVDGTARTVTLAGPLSGLPGTGYLEAAADPADRDSFIRVLEIEAQVLESGVVAETFSNLTWNNDPAAPSFARYYASRINDKDTGSALVSLAEPAALGTALANQPTTERGFPLSLISGDDGGDLTAVNLIGADNGPGKRTGIEALRERDDVALVAVPGVTDEAVQGALITHCELLKYRFAVLDGRAGISDVTEIQAHRNNYDSQYAAYYAPWLETLDLTTGNTISVPPSGAMLGIYARSDNDRGVHKAPANEVVQGITDLELPFTTGEQDVLNPVGVNLIRGFTQRGIRVWGARTISSDADWKYVNVRRLFIFLEHSIDIGTQWVVFEPNNESLWARVIETIVPFLTGVWKTGAMMGTKPDEAFFVKCDRSTMTQDDIDNGRLVCEIGVAPTKPAEFVVFRIGQFTAQSA